MYIWTIYNLFYLTHGDVLLPFTLTPTPTSLFLYNLFLLSKTLGHLYRTLLFLRPN